ncbi:MAG: hypothetical protein ACYS1C_07280, partial [Planctomycetota bacterium]
MALARRIAVVERAWYPAVAFGRAGGMAAWRSFETDAPPDRPEQLRAAPLDADGVGKAVRVAGGHFHGCPRAVRRRGGWHVLAVRRQAGTWRLVRHDLATSLRVVRDEALSDETGSVTGFDVATGGPRRFVIMTQAGP